MAETKEYSVAGLAIRKAALLEQLGRVSKSDSFSTMLLMGKIKAVQRQIEATTAPPFKE